MWQKQMTRYIYKGNEKWILRPVGIVLSSLCVNFNLALSSSRVCMCVCGWGDIYNLERLNCAKRPKQSLSLKWREAVRHDPPLYIYIRVQRQLDFHPKREFYLISLDTALHLRALRKGGGGGIKSIIPVPFSPRTHTGGKDNATRPISQLLTVSRRKSPRRPPPTVKMDISIVV